MPRFIFKCPYIRGGSAHAASHLDNYVRYMATREGAQRIAPARAQLPATKKQREMVEQLSRDYPLSRGMYEYKDYEVSPTQGNASEFITCALEDNYDRIAKRENYVSYIASRPRAQRTGAHALFSSTDDPLALSRVADEVAHHPGNVWLPILSLRREDAARLGYDSVENWRELIRSNAVELAKAMKIPSEQFRWYAAFHNEGHHPHLHMVCYSADGTSGYLTKAGIAGIKTSLARQIFQQELTELYQKQTHQRDTLIREAGEVIHQLRTGTLESPKIEQLMAELSERLKHTGGKKQYGFLKAPLKAVVDEIVDELAKDSRVSRAYTLWQELREDVLGTYREEMPERLRLSEQKEFKRIKNLVIEEALQLAELSAVFHPEDETHAPAPETAEQDEQIPEAAVQAEDSSASMPNRTKAYRQAEHILAAPTSNPEQIAEALEQLTEAAKAGHDRAQYLLGKLLLDGRAGLKQDAPAALDWLKRSAEAGNPFVQYMLGKILLQGEAVPKDVPAALRAFTAAAEQGDPYAQYTLGKLYLLGKEVPPDRDAAIRWLTLSAAQGNSYAQFYLDRSEQLQGASILDCATRLLYHMSKIFEEQTSAAQNRAITFTDKKLRQRIREKKIAMGHKPDDHEDGGIRMA